MLCNYRYCQVELPEYENGNRRYCDEHCYMAEKLERAKDNYASRKKSLSEIDRIETLLRVCQKKYGDGLFDINVLRAEKMNWVITTGSVTLDGIEYRVVGSFAYSAFADGNIRIVKL